MELLNVRKAPDEELLAIVETDACGADAIQVMTGCTFEKGNFVFKNYGKHAFFLIDRRKGKGEGVCLRPDAFQLDKENLSLEDKEYERLEQSWSPLFRAPTGHWVRINCLTILTFLVTHVFNFYMFKTYN
jgi:formylmethanofuran dehydrogenase subunit E